MKKGTKSKMELVKQARELFDKGLSTKEIVVALQIPKSGFAELNKYIQLWKKETSAPNTSPVTPPDSSNNLNQEPRVSRSEQITALLEKLTAGNQYLTTQEKALFQDLKRDQYFDEKGVSIGEFWSQYQISMNFGFAPGKVMDSQSEVVPDLSLTVRQLIQNHTRLKESQVRSSEPMYLDIEIPQIRDFTDVQRYHEHLQQHAADVKAMIDAEKAAAEEAAKVQVEANKDDQSTSKEKTQSEG